MSDRAPFAGDAPVLRWVSDRGLLVAWTASISRANTDRVADALASLREAKIPGVRDLHPAFASILVEVDPIAVRGVEIHERVRQALTGAMATERPSSRCVEIPVCYAPEYALDLSEVAARLDLSPAEFVECHCAAEYFVAFLGFTPGFPYLGGLPERLIVPRRAEPRLRVPSGSVAIAGAQAGIYPAATAGGWQIVGRTPSTLFDLRRDPPTLVAVGDRLRFVPITPAELVRGIRG